MKNIVLAFIVSYCGLIFLNSCQRLAQTNPRPQFISIDGANLRTPDGQIFYIQGTNLGNWLNPEGYMFGFRNTNSAHRIDEAFRELVGPDFTDLFWQKYKDNYITREDIRYLKNEGVNSIRLPFHYKLFTHEDYLGLTNNQDGFARIDSLIQWCRESEIYIILDMHDAPGGQTGDNIDDSYGYPWLMVSPRSQDLLVEIWRKIADRYKDEPIILGYDLLNEPIATHFEDELEFLNQQLEPLYKRVVKAIREVDTNHIILLGGAQWNSNFKIFTNSKFDDKIMYTCHRYWCDTTQENIQDFVDFRDSVKLPMYMGETGENTYEWMTAWTRLMKQNNIGYHYWPYKKMLSNRCMVTIPTPENWQLIVDFVESSRRTYKEIRAARPNQQIAQKALTEFLENCRFAHCQPNGGYIKAMGLHSSRYKH